MNRFYLTIGVAVLLCGSARAMPRDVSAQPIEAGMSTAGNDKLRPARHVSYSVRTRCCTASREAGFGAAAISEVYRNIDTQIGWYAMAPGDLVGDVLVPVAHAGKLDSLTCTMVNVARPDPNDPNGTNAADLLSADFTLTLFNTPTEHADPNLALATYTGSFDFTDPNTGDGLAPGTFACITFADLASDPNLVILPDCEFLAIQSYEDAVWGPGIAGYLGAAIMHPPGIGSSEDTFFVDNHLDPPGFYILPSKPANPGWVVTESDAIDCPVPAVVYSNTNGSPRAAYVQAVGTEVGDDVALIGGGILKELQFTCYNPDQLDPNEPNSCDKSAIEGLDVTIVIRRADSGVELGRLTRQLIYGSGLEALHPGHFVHCTLTELDADPNSTIHLTTPDIIVAAIFDNVVWSDPGCTGPVGQVTYFDPNGCATDTWAPTPNPTGTSGDVFAIDGALGFSLGGCPTVANFYWEITVADLEPFGTTVDRLPAFPAPAARYWFDPPIAGFGGGSGNWRGELPEIVPFLESSHYLLRTDPNAISDHACLGWVFRELDGTSAREALPETPIPGILAGDYVTLLMLHETRTDISATDGEAGPLNREITIGNLDPNDPGGPLIPLLDRQGLGNGTTPLTRRYSPVVESGNFDLQAVVFDVEADPNTETVTSLWTRWDDSTLELAGSRTDELVIHRFKAGVFTISGAQTLPGDSSCDGYVNNGDIDPFVIAVGSQAAWEALPGSTCGFLAANDMNNDGFVNNGDIDPFVDALTK